MSEDGAENRAGAGVCGRPGALPFSSNKSDFIIAFVLAVLSVIFFMFYRVPFLQSGDAAKYAFYMESGRLFGIPIHLTYIGTGIFFHWLGSPLHLSYLTMSMFTSAFFAGVGVGMTYLMARGVCGLTPVFAFLSALLLAFSKPYLFLGGAVQYGSAQVAAFLCAFYLLSRWRPWLAGCALAFCTLVTPSTVLCYPPLLLFALLSRRWKEAIIFTGVCGVIALGFSLIDIQGYYLSSRGLFPAAATGRGMVTPSWAKVLLIASPFWVGWRWYLLLALAGVSPLFRRTSKFAWAALLLAFMHFAYYSGYIFKPVFCLSLCPMLALFVGAGLQEEYRLAENLVSPGGRCLGRLGVVLISLMALSFILRGNLAYQVSRRIVKHKEMLEMNEVGRLMGPGDKFVGSFTRIPPWAYATHGSPYAEERGEVLRAVEGNQESNLFVHRDSLEAMEKLCREYGVQMSVRKTLLNGYTYGYIPKGAFHAQASNP